jgi:hypothetical protein
MRMGIGTRRRWALGAVLAVAALALAGVVAFALAVSGLRDRLEVALGPRAEMASLRVGWSGVVLEDVRVPGPKGWPAKETFRAERVEIVPTLRSLFSDRYRIWSVTLIKPYISVLRTRARKVTTLPGLFEGNATGSAARRGDPEDRARRRVLEIRRAAGHRRQAALEQVEVTSTRSTPRPRPSEFSSTPW